MEASNATANFIETKSDLRPFLIETVKQIFNPDVIIEEN